MRRPIVCALMMTALLAGCGKNEAEDAFMSFRQELLQRETVELRADVTADLDDLVFECSLEYVWDAEEDRGEVLVTAPESVEGVRAAISGGKLELGYDTVLLGAGESSAAVFAPITSLSVFLRSWLDAPVTASCFEELDGVRAVRATMSGEDGRTVYELWLDAATREPMAAELAQDGKTVLRARFAD